VKSSSTLLVVFTKGNPKAAQVARDIGVRVVQFNKLLATALSLVLEVVPDAGGRAAAGGNGGHGVYTGRGRDSAGMLVELSDEGNQILWRTQTEAQKTRNYQEKEVKVQLVCVKSLAVVAPCPWCFKRLRPLVMYPRHIIGCYLGGCPYKMSWESVKSAAADFDEQYAVGPPDIARHVIHGR